MSSRSSWSISSPLLLLSLPLLTVSTWSPKCDGTSEPKDLHGRSYALLHAHRSFFTTLSKRNFNDNLSVKNLNLFSDQISFFRCFLKDVPVLVSSPLNSIPDFVIPSHVVVPRCQGLCLGSLGGFPLSCQAPASTSGSDCAPKRTKIEEHNIVVYVNATPYCTTIQMEHHRGPCRWQLFSLYRESEFFWWVVSPTFLAGRVSVKSMRSQRWGRELNPELQLFQYWQKQPFSLKFGF